MLVSLSNLVLHRFRSLGEVLEVGIPICLLKLFDLSSVALFSAVDVIVLHQKLLLIICLIVVFSCADSCVLSVLVNCAHLFKALLDHLLLL